MKYRIKGKNHRYTVQQKRWLYWSDSIKDWNYYYDTPAVYDSMEEAREFIRYRREKEKRKEAPTTYYYY